MSCGSATGTWFGNVNEVRNPTVVVKNFLACSGHRLLADDSVPMLWYQLISTRLFLCIFKVQQFRPWQMFVELIYIYHNPGKAVSTAEACLSRSVKYSGRMETPELCPAFRARALRGERKFQTLWLSILGKRVSFKGPWAKKSGIGFNFKLNTIHRTLLPLYKHPLYDKSLCIGI